MNQALIALRELLIPGGREMPGLVTAVAAGQYLVATKSGTRSYPAAAGVSAAPGQRVLIENGLVVRVLGARADVPVFHV